ncbi:MAG: hypothetical protein PHI79_00315 [Sulfurovaceae bacterium]|nr:hypothetical protein [Sulfurovaceae bacterium]MDD5548021.1 hypothetical protein [Sulfurovaceae bacterium]
MNSVNNVEKYDFDIMELIKTSFRMTKGFKGAFWATTFIFALIFAALFYLVTHLFFPNFTAETMQTHEFAMKSQYIMLILLPIVTSFLVLLQMMSLQHARGEDIIIRNIFSDIKIIWRLLFVAFIFFIPNIIIDYIFGFALLVSEINFLTVIKSAISWAIAIVSYFSFMLIVDKNIGAIEAIKLSFMSIKQKIWKIFAVYLFFYGIFFIYPFLDQTIILPQFSFLISVVVLICMIWFYPAMIIGTNGLLYRIMFDGMKLNSK